MVGDGERTRERGEVNVSGGVAMGGDAVVRKSSALSKRGMSAQTGEERWPPRIQRRQEPTPTKRG